MNEHMQSKDYESLGLYDDMTDAVCVIEPEQELKSGYFKLHGFNENIVLAFRKALADRDAVIAGLRRTVYIWILIASLLGGSCFALVWLK